MKILWVLLSFPFITIGVLALPTGNLPGSEKGGTEVKLSNVSTATEAVAPDNAMAKEDGNASAKKDESIQDSGQGPSKSSDSSPGMGSSVSMKSISPKPEAHGNTTMPASNTSVVKTDPGNTKKPQNSEDVEDTPEKAKTDAQKTNEAEVRQQLAAGGTSKAPSEAEIQKNNASSVPKSTQAPVTSDSEKKDDTDKQDAPAQTEQKKPEAADSKEGKDTDVKGDSNVATKEEDMGSPESTAAHPEKVNQGTNDKEPAAKGPEVHKSSMEPSFAYDDDNGDGSALIGIETDRTNGIEQDDDQAYEGDDEFEDDVTKGIADGEEETQKLEQLDHNGQFTTDADSHFFAYFLTIMVTVIIFYLVFHNKQRIIALIIEGRAPRNGRTRRASSRAKYHKLDNNLEEAIIATKGSNGF